MENIKEKIENEAVKMAKEIGVNNVTCKALCDAVGISTGSWFYTMGVKFEDFIKTIKAEESPYVVKKRADKESRARHIVQSAIDLSERIGYQNIDRRSVAEEAGISYELVAHYFPNIDELKELVMQNAVHTRNVTILAQGLANKDKTAQSAEESLKIQAAQSLLQ